MHHVVMFSGGIGSYATAKRVRQQYFETGDQLTLLFADVGGDRSNPHAGEDEDCYRFIEEAAQAIPDAELVIVKDGRTIWEVFKDDRFLGNSRLANCSKFLKQRPSRKWLEENTDPFDTAVYVGIDWTETHRVPAIEAGYLPWIAFAPMTEPPWTSKEDMIKECLEDGVDPPRMYQAGYPHANCGGGCVRAGQGQFKLLLETNPERFADWERNEQELRDYLGKDVAILRDRSKASVAEYNVDLLSESERLGVEFKPATAVPLTLTMFRHRVQGTSPGEVEEDDIGGCGCFTDDLTSNEES